MTKKKTSSKNDGPQGVVLEIPKESLPERITYDVDALRKFISFVFDDEDLPDDENILVWKSTGMSPGYPSKSVEGMLAQLKKATRPQKLYYGTSTTEPDADGSLRNRKVLFKQFYVLVLDDVGTKVPLEKIPAGFTPTYIIESSKGNFQYGYVLHEAITNLEQATALVQLVYDGGFSDAGGAMATKLVRLPGGVNGKKGDGENYPVTLVSMDEENLWTPDEILDALDLGVKWSDVVADCDKVMKERKVGKSKLTAWSGVKPELPSLDGSIDEVAEWLYSAGRVKQETPEWLTIECPWCDSHTEGGDNTASYSPIGWGVPPYQASRIFHCFHEHCRGHKSGDFLKYVADLGGPAMPVRDEAHELVSRYAFDRLDNGVWDIHVQGQPEHIKMDAFNYEHPHKVIIPVEGKDAGIKVPETSLFKLAKGRITVSGPTYDPTTPAKIVKHGNRLHTNLYTQPSWGDGEYAASDIDMFTLFLEYLIPDMASREYYTDWLAAKAQSMAFRGPAILMIAPSQGTGRTTLGNMLATLFGRENVERVPFERLSQGGGNFNDWIVKPIIITDETLALGDETNFFKVYERLKELIDTTPQEVRVNPKFGKQRFQTTYSSFMLFSNHENAMKIADNDRRIYVLKNVNVPATSEYFTKLNAWLEQGAWARSVWRWLRKREVNVGKLVAPPEKTKAKDDLMAASKQPLDIAVETVLKLWPVDQVAWCQIGPILAHWKMKYRLKDIEKFDTIAQAILKHQTFPIPNKVKLDVGTRKVWYIKGRSSPIENNPAEVLHSVDQELHDRLKNEIEIALEEHDF